MSEMNTFLLRLAGKTIRVACRFPQTAVFCGDYICGKDAAGQEADNEIDVDMEIRVSEKRMAAERALSPGYSDAYLETLCIYRQIAEQLPSRGCAVFHGAVIRFHGAAYFFAAPSGTGKSTHIALWRKYLGKDVGIVNGDKPILSDTGAEIVAYGTPWAGKEKWQENCCAPVKGGCFLRQAEKNRIIPLRPDECADLLVRQFYLPSGADAAVRTLELADRMTELVPLWLLECDMSREAVRLSFEAMTGLDFALLQAKGGEDEN